MTEPLQTQEVAARRDWLAVLARASTAELEACAQCAEPLPPMQTVRPAEVGMTMLRGRTGGTGAAFNLGEASVTRCALRVAGVLGVGYTLGRDRRKAELVALFDALLQQDEHRWLRKVVEPLRERQARDRAAKSRAAASSRVDFFTMVRGEA
jgi:alpha-D-ribose 1-methylphosphonate 5-triphosphate synthase subunit PhnG